MTKIQKFNKNLQEEENEWEKAFQPNRKKDEKKSRGGNNNNSRGRGRSKSGE